MKRLTAALAAGVFVLSGCGSAPDHNDADVMFAQMMIPHHRQAVEMAELAAGKAGPQVTKLAAGIEKAQGPEIAKMSGWLKAWGERPHAMDHGDGMMSGADMAKLRGTSGAAFDRMFLTMMIKHHQGAVTMARTERAKGTYRPATSMAASIITTQNAEIAKMRGLLK